MKKHKLIIQAFILLLALTPVFNACRKYPEDGKLSWHRPEKRILGNWYLKEFLVNGEDSLNHTYIFVNTNQDTTSYFVSNMLIGFSNGKGLDKDSPYYKKNSYGVIFDFYIGNNPSPTKIHKIDYNDFYSFKDHKTRLNFPTQFSDHYNYYPNVFPIFGTKISSAWDIRKLTDKEMILEVINDHGKQIRLKFQR